MAKFMVLYRSSASADEQMASTTPEQREAGMDLWMQWMRKAGTAVVDFGFPFGSARCVPADSRRGSEHIGGYSILQADSIDAVEALLGTHPHFHAPRASIEVLELWTMPGMS